MKPYVTPARSSTRISRRCVPVGSALSRMTIILSGAAIAKIEVMIQAGATRLVTAVVSP